MIYGGFTYNGKHSLRDMGIVVQTADRALVPPQKTAQDSQEGRDSIADYTSVNALSRALFDNKTVSVNCKFKRRGSYEDLQRQTAKISAWLSNTGGGYLPLVFDDMPAVVWHAKPANNIPVQFQYAAMGSFSITFDCRPFNTLTFNSENMTLDADIPLDSEFYLGDDFILANELSLTLYNTDAPSAPRFLINGSGSSISVSCGGRTVSYPKAFSGELIIDCGQRCIFINGSLAEEGGGDYFELQDGDNAVSVSGSGLSGSMTVIYEYSMFYGL